ncbi:radical SAM protein [bacterium]|nr:radical SAM protein [candidate division CSSED10-310 bacterium]
MGFPRVRKRTLKQLINTFRIRYGRFTEPICRHDPSDIMVFITTRCNLKCNRCPFMQNSPYSPPTAIPDISLDFFEQILDCYHKASVVGLVGGEPLLHSNLIDLIWSASRFKMTVNVSTNGILLTEEYSRKLLDTPLGFLNVSLDAPDPETYQRVRGGSENIFHRILENTAAFSDLRNKSNPLTKLWLSYVADIDNVTRIPEFALLAKEIGADVVFCQNVLSYQCSDLTSGSKALHDTPEVRKLISQLEIPGGIQVIMPPLIPQEESCHCVKCKHPFTMLSLDGAGNLSPCCVIPPHPKYGNIAQNISGWRNVSPLKEIRSSMLHDTDAFDEICLDCWERFSMGHENHS